MCFALLNKAVFIRKLPFPDSNKVEMPVVERRCRSQDWQWVVREFCRFADENDWWPGDGDLQFAGQQRRGKLWKKVSIR
jgi:hypothetical protein